MTLIQCIFLFILVLNHTSAFHIHGMKIVRPSPMGSKDIFLLPTPNSPLYSTESEYDTGASRKESVTPKTFREAEVLGLRLMQEGQIEEALKVFQNGLKLPGSRTDIIRTKNISGPSPVGGSAGGTEGRQVQTLDEFEMQAAHYNIACAYARMDKSKEACESLEQAFKAGFDNYATVAADPDLASLKNTSDYDNLMSRYDKKGFNPFGLFQK